MMDLQARYNAGEPITATELAKLNDAKSQISSLGQEVYDLPLNAHEINVEAEVVVT